MATARARLLPSIAARRSGLAIGGNLKNRRDFSGGAPRPSASLDVASRRLLEDIFLSNLPSFHLSMDHCLMTPRRGDCGMTGMENVDVHHLGLRRACSTRRARQRVVARCVRKAPAGNIPPRRTMAYRPRLPAAPTLCRNKPWRYSSRRVSNWLT